MFSAPMGTLTEVKNRLRIGDTNDDTVLSEMLLASSAAIEAAAGRPLRRGHCMRERFAGGTPLLRVARPPIARIHYIRESFDYDFRDTGSVPDISGEYDELEEGVDYILEPVDGTRPGELGWIRRIDGNWIGSRDGELPGMVEVCYTGGYKTAGELALENSSLTMDGSTNTSLIDAFSIGARYSSSSLDGYLARFLNATTAKVGVEFSSPVDLVNRAFVVFRPGSVLIPTWEVVEATLVLSMNRSDGSGTVSVDAYLLSVDPRTMLDKLATLWDETDELVDGKVLSAATRSSGSFSDSTITVHSDSGLQCAENMAILNQVLRQGFLAFALKAGSETLGTSLAASFCTPRHATAGDRPELTLVHRDTINDDWSMPDDLRSACLLQTASDFQSRRQPAMRQETQRGVSISSGVSYLRDPSDLLPQVLAVAQRYARLI